MKVRHSIEKKKLLLIYKKGLGQKVDATLTGMTQFVNKKTDAPVEVLLSGDSYRKMGHANGGQISVCAYLEINL